MFYKTKGQRWLNCIPLGLWNKLTPTEKEAVANVSLKLTKYDEGESQD